MGRKDNVHGTTLDPLTADQITRFIAAARQTGDDLTTTIALTLPNTGLRNTELCHMRRDWLQGESANDVLTLEVPPEAECIGGIGTSGPSDEQKADKSSPGEPCHKCRDRRDGIWKPKSDAAQRQIPITSEIYQLLEDWFDDHEQIPLLHSAVSSRVRDVAEEAGIERDVTPHNLRDTYGMLLAREEFNLQTICRIMGHTRTSIIPARPHSEMDSTVDWDEEDDCTSDEDQQMSGEDDGC